jgi:mRNA-degrading endonuclease RelE of RelBE toxin-antitoxin system
MPNLVEIRPRARVEMKDLSEEKFLRIMEKFRELAKTKSPYDTGTNRASINFEKLGMDGNIMKFRLFTTSNYGAWLELGTARMAARPYILPAFREALKRFDS